jgi:hypothetical protein
MNHNQPKLNKSDSWISDILKLQLQLRSSCIRSKLRKPKNKNFGSHPRENSFNPIKSEINRWYHQFSFLFLVARVFAKIISVTMSNKNWILIFYYSQEKMFVLFFKVKVALESCKDKTKQKEKKRSGCCRPKNN